MNCAHCRTRLAEEHSFCPACGRPLDPARLDSWESRRSSVARTAKEAKRIGIWTGVTMGVLSGVLSLATLLSSVFAIMFSFASSEGALGGYGQNSDWPWYTNTYVLGNAGLVVLIGSVVVLGLGATRSDLGKPFIIGAVKGWFAVLLVAVVLTLILAIAIDLI